MNSGKRSKNRKKERKEKLLILNQESISKKSFEEKSKRDNTKLHFIRKLIFLILLMFLFLFLKFGPHEIEKIKGKEKDVTFDLKSKNIRYSEYEEEYKNKNSFCDEIDPIYLLKQRIDKGPIVICSGEKSKHICYQNVNNHNNDIYAHKNGTICTMENIVLDPSKSRQSGISFTSGPIDFSHEGFPLLAKGFYNAECRVNDTISFKYNKIYNTYFNSWNYEYNINNENLDELAPGKTVFFISRNEDSPNLFHGYSEIINVLAMIYLFNLDPNDIQVVFLESIEIPYYKEVNSDNKDIPRDPFYDIYKKMISRGGEPIYIKNLKKKYKISKAIHAPINWDSPLYIDVDYPKCEYWTKSYKLINDLVDKYMDIKPFKDTFISDNETYYYPESVLKSHESNIKFDKIVTIQWRRIWPKNRKGQGRIMNNGPQLADKLASLLPKNILVRLINNAKFTMEEQISLARNTDYLIGIHGAGLSLSMFLPHNSILHEVQHNKMRSVLSLISALSGHRTFNDLVKNSVTHEGGNEMVSFDEEDFSNIILKRMKEINFI